MANKSRKIQIFSAGCSMCDDVIRAVKAAACPSCAIEVLDMKSPDVKRKATGFGIKSVPAVVIDGKLADCCSGSGVDVGVLSAAGLGQPIA